MSAVLQELDRRGFVAQDTDRPGLTALLARPATVYCGFDPTADSLHAGSLVPLMALGHLARAGHRVLAVIGTGTAMVGDPSGKTELRQLLSAEQIEANGTAIGAQIRRLIGGLGRVEHLHNGQWLLPWRYVDFLREIGRHFSVNKMLTAESYKLRLERGLSFLEFNYQLLQAYDFAYLAKAQGCLLQVGGDDQWGNIVAGTDLVRRLHGQQAYGLTFPLLTTASGGKMGKTESGALWLDARRTSPYEYFQYWVNVDDRDVARFLALFTWLPVGEIEAVRAMSGAALNAAKLALAFEATAICHGPEEARAALLATWANFGAHPVPPEILPSASAQLRAAPDAGPVEVPSTRLAWTELSAEPSLAALLVRCGLADSKGAARRLVSGGGAYLNGQRVDDPQRSIGRDDFVAGVLTLRAGKKKHHQVLLDER